jgi:hypothetical protein
VSRRWILLAVVASLAGCAGVVTGGGEDGADEDGDGKPDDAGDPTLPDPVGREPGAPVLTIDTPARGTIIDGDTVFVSGRVTADGSAVESLTINGRPTGIAEDGTFTAAVTLPPGITVLETAATSVDGPRASDVRSVLAGRMAEPDTSIDSGVTAHLGPRAIARLVRLVGDAARAINLTAAATAMNPVVDTGGSCNSARIYIGSVGRSSINVGAAPVSGGVDVGAQVSGLVVNGRVTFRVLCISGSTSWTIRANVFGARGVFRPTLADGGIRVGLTGVQAGFGGFSLSVGGVPSFITNLFTGTVRDRLSAMLRDRIAGTVPRQVTSLLRDFGAREVEVSVLGKKVRAGVYPTAMSWSSVGATIGLRTWTIVEGSDTPYLYTPTGAPPRDAIVSNDLRVSVSDDAVDQLLTGLWGAGAFEARATEALKVELGELGIDSDFAGGSIQLSLPPVATFDAGTGTGRVVLGDLLIEGSTPAGSTTLAVSAVIDVAARVAADGRVRLVALPPQVRFQMLGDRVAEELDPELAGQVAAMVSETLARDIDDALGTLVIPGLPGADLSDVGIAPIGGHMVAGGTLSFQ